MTALRHAGSLAAARFLTVAVLSLGLSACASSCDKGSGDPTPDAGARTTDAATERTARCTGPVSQRALASVTEVGPAVVLGRTVAIGVLFDPGGGGGVHQGVVLTDDAVSKVTVKDLGVGIADGPPPRPFVGGADLWVAFHPMPARDAGAGASPHGLVLRAQKLLDDAGAPIEFARGGSSSLAFDVAWAKGSVIAAWEEDVERRGVIRIARAGKGALTISPATTDAEEPKLLALADGRVVVAWTGRRDEPVDAGREHELERPSEARAFRWAEVAFADPDKLDPSLGKPLEDGGAPKPLFTPYRASAENGHVVAVELGAAPGGAVAFVQDDGAEADGAGGRILSFVLTPSQARDTRVLVARNVGHALFDYLPVSATAEGPEGAAFISFADVAEHQMLAQSAADSTATLEPTMDPGRPLAMLPAPGRGVERRVLALKVPGATGGNGSSPAELWVLTCTP